MKISFLFFLLLVAVCSISAHPVHVSITTIEYQPEKKGFVIAIKIFYDDMNLLVYNNYKENLNFVGYKKESEKNCVKYISSVFAVSINNKDQNGRMKFAFSEIHSDAVWIYYVLPFKESITNVSVKNKLLNELYPDQKNLVIVKVNDFEKGFSLSNKETECKIEL